jgi:hypothetical protein
MAEQPGVVEEELRGPDDPFVEVAVVRLQHEYD